MTMDAVAAEAGVGKPAIYRRYRDKAQMVASVVAEQLPVMEPPDLGDTRAEMLAMFTHGLPAEGLPYVALIGGLIAEHGRHPELIEAFRERVLLPRRAMVQSVIERGQARGDIRSDLDPVMGIDLLAGQFLARVFAGSTWGPPGASGRSSSGGRPSRANPGAADEYRILNRHRPPSGRGLRLRHRPGQPPRVAAHHARGPDGGRRPNGVGTRHARGSARPFGRRIESLVEVSEYEPDRRFSLR